jgi:hypothetical protein
VPAKPLKNAETPGHIGPPSKVWHGDGQRKYPRSNLLLSSADRGWTTLSAELRSHSAGRIVSIAQQSVEVVIALAGADGPVRRIGAGRQEQTRPDAGTIWLVPTGVEPEEIVIAAPMPKTLHLFLSRKEDDRRRHTSLKRNRISLRLLLTGELHARVPTRHEFDARRIQAAPPLMPPRRFAAAQQPRKLPSAKGGASATLQP